ncbi:hypothetical protein PAXRUDRAFT_411892 [Paxillus rubicundulus Ve08.2h10]|uniref:Unplaced genomic scaffold scaffold_2474, whole genome shotgun sequence n=1 Tax=Paxillus rubicundulus Ve08.2h10 TaxID=930991 RepID=A0A0D0D8Q0_9AGAM|nr:hypothetical protein PAXRUDRAFT_411892 [Paxillus rubicundulus Ve08.2h10]
MWSQGTVGWPKAWVAGTLVLVLSSSAERPMGLWTDPRATISLLSDGAADEPGPGPRFLVSSAVFGRSDRLLVAALPARDRESTRYVQLPPRTRFAVNNSSNVVAASNVPLSLPAVTSTVSTVSLIGSWGRRGLRVLLICE